MPFRIAPDAITITCNKIARPRNNIHIAGAGMIRHSKGRTMRSFEDVATSVMAIATQALVIGVIFTI